MDAWIHAISLGVNVTALLAVAVQWGVMREKLRRLEKDVNGIGRKQRQEIEDHLRDYHSTQFSPTPVRGVPILPPPPPKGTKR